MPKKTKKKLVKQPTKLKKPQKSEWKLSNKEKAMIGIILEKPMVSNQELADRIGYKDATWVCRIRRRPHVAEVLDRILMEPIERMRDAKRLAVHKLISLLKSRDTNDVKYAIDRILAAEINVVKAQLDVNLEKTERYVVEVKHDDGTIVTYKSEDNEEVEDETKKMG